MSNTRLHPMRDARWWTKDVNPSTEWRFFVKVGGSGDADECWPWEGHVGGTGYGGFQLTPTERRHAHRFAYEFLIGEIPKGLQLDHLCRNRACVNPWHLDPVTPLVNTRRGEGHGRETHCPEGHPYAGDNLYERFGRRYCRTCNRARAAQWRRCQAALARVREHAERDAA